MKIIKNIFIVFLVVMMLTSCSGTMIFEIPPDASIGGGFQYGLFQGFIVYPIGFIINNLTVLTGSAAVAMIITTIIIRSITLPATIKGQLATRQMQELQPKIQAIEEKYRGREDQGATQRKQAEMQKIYQDMGVSPIGGMLYPFLSLPFFMGVWRATTLVTVIKDADPFLGLFNLGVTPQSAISNGEYVYVVLIVLVVVSQVIQFRLTNHLSTKRNKESKTYIHNPKADAMAKQMNIMMYVMAAMMGFMSFTLMSAMSVYLIVSALISMGQAFYIDNVMRKAE